MGPSPAIFSRTQLQLAIKDISSSHRTPLSISAKHVKEVNSMGSRQEGGGRSHTFVASKNALDIYFFLLTLCILCMTLISLVALARPYVLSVSGGNGLGLSGHQ